MKLFLVLLAVFFLSTHASYLDDVTKLLEKLAKLKNEEFNILDELNDVVEDSPVFLKLASSVGSLIAAGANSTFDPDSDEQKALVKLQDEMAQYFRNRNIMDDVSRYSSIESFFYLTYEIASTQSLRDVLELFTHVASPTSTRRHDPSSRPVFSHACSKILPETLAYFHRQFREGCPLPKRDTILRYLRGEKAFHQLECRIARALKPSSAVSSFLGLKSLPNSSSQKQYEYAKRRLSSLIHALDKQNADELIYKIENIHVLDYDDLLKEVLFLEVNYRNEEQRRGSFSDCNMDVAILLQDRKKFMEKFRTLALDLTKAQLFVGACKGVGVSPDEKMRVELTEEEKKTSRLEAIGRHVVSWVGQTLDLSWPEVGIESAKMALGSEWISVEKFNDSARIVREELEKHGPEGYFYEVLITETKQMDDYWSVTAEPGYYANFTGFNGIDCHVFRYAKRDFELMGNTTLLEVNHNALIKLLKKATPDRSAKDILFTLHPFYQDKLYKSAILLKNDAFFKNSAEIKTGEAFWMQANETIAATSIHFFTNPLLSKAFSWKLYMFL